MKHSELETIKAHTSAHTLDASGLFPNNPQLPVMVYKGCIFMHPDEGAEHVADIFRKNGWHGTWQGDVYDFDHFHTNTHEALGVACGTVSIHLGGGDGVCVELSRGDVVLIPAGVAHRKLSSSEDFICVGAYPLDEKYDMNRGNEKSMDEFKVEIAAVPLPKTDPVYGESGEMLKCWTNT